MASALCTLTLTSLNCNVPACALIPNYLYWTILLSKQFETIACGPVSTSEPCLGSSLQLHYSEVSNSTTTMHVNLGTLFYFILCFLSLALKMAASGGFKMALILRIVIHSLAQGRVENSLFCICACKITNAYFLSLSPLPPLHLDLLQVLRPTSRGLHWFHG